MGAMMEAARLHAEDGVDRDRLSRWLASRPRLTDVAERLVAAGCTVETDAAGNILARHRGHDPSTLPVLVVFRADGVTDADLPDDGAGLASLLELLAVLRETPGVDHPPLELVVTAGAQGGRAIDARGLRASHGFVVETGEPVGTITYGAPALTELDVTIRGRRASIGAAPEHTVSAIEVAADALTRMELGRVDDETYTNVGTIHGGQSRGEVADVVRLEALVRSRSNERLDRQVEAICAAVGGAAARARAVATIERDDVYRAFRLRFDSPPFLEAARAAEAVGLSVRRRQGDVGTDANHLDAAGIPAVALSTGAVDGGRGSSDGPIQDLVDATRHVIRIVTQPSMA